MAIGTTATRAQLGRELKALRLRAGMSTTGAAQVLRQTASTYRKYEAGIVTIPYPALDLLLRTWELTSAEERAVLEELREQASQRVWWSGYRLTESTGRLVGFEQMATQIRVFEAAFIYGPLQTEDYARTVITVVNPPDCDEATIERDVRLRMERADRLLRGEPRPELWIVLDESVLRRNVGGPAVMLRQLATLADLTHSLRLRVLPLGAPAHRGMLGAFQLFDFPPHLREPAVYVEGPQKNHYVEDDPGVSRARVDHARLWELALEPAASRDLILTVMEDFK